MSTFINYLNRPEYIFQPFQLLHRLFFSARSGRHSKVEIRLPWGAKLQVCPKEVMGYSLRTMGVYDLAVTETLWRLIDCGEAVVDVGANIGYMTSVMAFKVGKTGSVYCFEPHPGLYAELDNHINNWHIHLQWRHIKSHKLGLSDHNGEGTLFTPAFFAVNQGIARLVSTITDTGQSSQDKHYTVSLATLDTLFQGMPEIGVVKIDVEGHELSVLLGAANLIKEQRIRDIIFESFESYPNQMTTFLENNGYTIFRICKRFWGPCLVSPLERDTTKEWESPSYLATKDVSRATQRMHKSGWRALKRN